MKRTSRRDLLKASLAGGLSVGAASRGPFAARHCRAAGPNEEVRLAVVGLGGINIPGGVGGRGRQLVKEFSQVPGVRITALCDVDEVTLDKEVRSFKEKNQTVAAYSDLRRVFDDDQIDAVVIATPNHWHALATIWACQAGKDVYVEKPFAHSIWEGRQAVAAARQYGRVVQVGTQRRSSPVVRQFVEYAQGGELGPLLRSRAIVYRAREGIGNVQQATPVPPTVDYDLWCGPTEVQPLMRKQLHYEWHWFWSTGNGEVGNNGAHHIDIARWTLGQEKSPPRVISLGGRFGFDDCGETANTQIAFFDYQPAPLICEIRNYREKKGVDTTGDFRGAKIGTVVEFEGGYLSIDGLKGAAFDEQGKKIKDFAKDQQEESEGVLHAANFIEAVRNKSSGNLNAEAQVGQASANCCHMANISHRLGEQLSPEAIAQSLRSNKELTDAFERCQAYLDDNGIDLANTPATLGPSLNLDQEREEFVGPFAEEANQLSRRTGREPFVIPQIA